MRIPYLDIDTSGPRASRLGAGFSTMSETSAL